MAGVVTHLAIAERIIDKLPNELIANKALFYAGSIAPDAIHARVDYVRADKKHTHLRDDIRDIDFCKDENITLFHNRVSKFINNNILGSDKLLDLYRGYVVHVLTDEMFMLTIRKEFANEMDRLGIEQSDKLFYSNIISDLNSNDFRLAKEYNQMKGICDLLENARPYCINGYLTEKELTVSRNWVMQKYFYQEHKNTEPIYISYDRVLKFIEETAQDIICKLSYGIMFPKIF